MDWAKLELLCEVSRTVERFGHLGGKANMPDKYDLPAHRQQLVILLT